MYNCQICGKEEKAEYLEPARSQMITRQLCFSCNYWIWQIERVNAPESVRVDGTHYTICPQRETPHPYAILGYSGREFTIRFFDGRIVTTHNLWRQGEIPTYFRGELPDNAEFI